MGISVDVYNSWIKDLAVREEDEGSKGMSMAQYTAQGYDNVIGNASMIFYKPSENTDGISFLWGLHRPDHCCVYWNASSSQSFAYYSYAWPRF